MTNRRFSLNYFNSSIIFPNKTKGIIKYVQNHENSLLTTIPNFDTIRSDKRDDGEKNKDKTFPESRRLL